MLVPIEDLRQGVDTATRFLTKEKIDRQLSDQSGTSTPFMKVSDGYKSSNKEAVSFNTCETYFFGEQNESTNGQVWHPI